MFLKNFLTEKNWQDFIKDPLKNIYAAENIWPFIISGLFNHYRIPIITVTSSYDKNMEFFEDFNAVLNTDDYVHYPYAGEGIYFKNRTVDSENISSRLSVLRKIKEYRQDKNPFIIIAGVSSLINLMPSEKEKVFDDLVLSKNAIISTDMLAENLSLLGYERVAKVFDKGEFSVKGDVFDIFDLSLKSPVRLDFFDDKIEKIFIYDENTRNIIKETDRIFITPNYNPWEIKNDKYSLPDLEKKQSHESFVSIFDYLDNNTEGYGVVLCDPLESYIKLKSEIDIIEKSFLADKENNRASNEELLKKFMLDKDFFENRNFKIQFNLNSLKSENFGSQDFFFNNIRNQKQNYGNSAAFLNNIESNFKKNKKIIISLKSSERTKKVEELFTENEFSFNNLNDSKDHDYFLLPKKVINITRASLLRGYESENYSIYGELDIYEQLERDEKAQIKISAANFNRFKPGDFIVHKTHGIGRYADIFSENVNGVKKDYFLIEYADKDKLYVPTWQAERIHKYLGDSEPQLTSLNSKQWENLKAKVRKSVKILAVDLARLYAEREAALGHAFLKDSPWQKEIEEFFPFTETEDQMKAIEYVKMKMEDSKPMDILLCGDVGFGKTEVAVRAAFKAISEGKQVLMLVPTTILADQHYNTFNKRYVNYPVRVDVISRFKKRSEQNLTVKDFNSGIIDMLIGTHRLLANDISPKDLGLLIIDEEQRFGVNAKEKIKLLKKEVDVLTMTATPIPRTLYMALTGIKDIVLIETHPENRHPIKTFVGRKNSMIIKAAIERELEREGQIYYVSDKIMQIEHIEFELKKLIPGLRIAVTHGQMDGKIIEKIMEDFINKKYDILLTTTIIESGLDIANVNTLIVENAHRFGLSQLYQLRGRVGRSSERAYAYLLYKERDSLTFNALERLKALDEYTELGSGYSIAMKDLEIRGAGELLGANQHGHLNSIGFDLYCDIIKEEIERLKGNEPESDINIVIDVPFSSYIPKTYIKNENERINIYKTLANLNETKEVEKLSKNLNEKYGNLPLVVSNLIIVAKIKLLLKSRNIERLVYIAGKGFVIKPVNTERSLALNINRKNKNIYYNFRDKSIIINNLNEKDKFSRLAEIISDIINSL